MDEKQQQEGVAASAPEAPQARDPEPTPVVQEQEAAPVTETPEDRMEELETPENIRTAPAPEVPREPTEAELALVADMPEENIPATWPEKVTATVDVPDPAATDLDSYTIQNAAGDPPAYNALDTGVGSPVADRASTFSPPADAEPVDTSDDSGVATDPAPRIDVFEGDSYTAVIDPGLTSDVAEQPVA
jgi:hypothetical protein